MPWTMLDPSKMAPGDRWEHRCGHCTVIAQGGLPGYQAHMLVCHPDKVPPAPRRSS